MNLSLTCSAFRRTRTLAVQCRYCEQWHHPRHIRVPAIVCTDCESTTGFQSAFTEDTPPEPQPGTPGGTQ